MEKIRIAMITDGLRLNGISSVVMNYCRRLNKDKYKITIFFTKQIIPTYEKELKELGIETIEVPPKRHSNSLKYYKFLKKNLVKEKFDIVHIHCNSATVTLELLIAKINKIKTRIAHCHSTGTNHPLIHKLFKPICNALMTERIACSEAAGKWLYGKNNFKVLNNAFDIYKYQFNDEFRKEIRKNININDNIYVMGHVGRFNGTKNQEFLFQIFDKIAEKIPESLLVMVGKGPDFEKFQQMRENSKFRERIILYGETNEPEKIYSAMDIFLFPSFYEGLGIVAIEAQLTGLKCIVSKNVPEVVKLTNELEFLPIGNENIEKWCDSIMQHHKENKRISIDFTNQKILAFDIKNNINELEKIYNQKEW